MLLSAKNIKNGGIYWDETDRRISYGEYEKIHSNFSLESGDVLLTIVGSIGETAILKDSEGITFQRSVAFLRPNNKITPDFLYSDIQTPTFQKELDSRKSTSAQPGIYLGDLAEIPLIFSTKIDEQKKIGEYFSNLDNLITLHQRKCEVLVNIKKSMLEKMFPKNGKKVPEIRFEGFTDDWEQRKVYEIADRFDNLRVPVAANLRVAGDTPYYGANGIQDYVDGYTHDGEYVLVAEDGASDLKNYPVNYVNGRIWVNNHAHVLQGKNNIASNRFLSYAISLANIESVLVGGGRAKLNADVMMNLNIDLPTYKEQCRVAEYFSNLDNLITLHQRKLEKLQNIKKSMLEQMLI